MFNSWTALVKNETKLQLSSSEKKRQNPCSESLPVYQDLSTRHRWFANKVEGKFEMYFL